MLSAAHDLLREEGGDGEGDEGAAPHQDLNVLAQGRKSDYLFLYRSFLLAKFECG